jgi:hypothetical protein
MTAPTCLHGSLLFLATTSAIDIAYSSQFIS